MREDRDQFMHQPDRDAMSSAQSDVEITDLWSEGRQPTLKVRLQSTMSRGGRLAGAWIFGLILCGVTYAISRALMGGEGLDVVSYAVLGFAAVVMGLLSLLLLWSAIHQTLAFAIPTTIIEVEREPIEPGASIMICVKQPGPTYLTSLRANLVCMQRKEKKVRHAGQTRHSRSPESMLHHENILDADGGWLFPSQIRQWTTQLAIPADAVESGKADSLVTRWHIEVWGRAQGFIGFMHSFDLQVRRSSDHGSSERHDHPDSESVHHE